MPIFGKDISMMYGVHISFYFLISEYSEVISCLDDLIVRCVVVKTDGKSAI
jgi:hypothetical protein